MKNRPISRREIFEKCITGGLLVAAVPCSQTRLLALWQQGESRAATPTDVLGPYFLEGAQNKPNLRIPGESGLPLRVTGRVVNTHGDVIPNATVDLWHADHAGQYDVKGYRYRSKIKSNDSGIYTFESIIPGHYKERPAQHIHYMIQAPGHKKLVTQNYFATDPYFKGEPDKNFGGRYIPKSKELIRPVTLLEEASGLRTAVTFDIVLENA